MVRKDSKDKLSYKVMIPGEREVSVAEDGRDNRRYERFHCKIRITYTILSEADATPLEYGVTYSTNLSEGGVCIFHTDREVKVPVLMQLNLGIPVRPFHLLILGKAVRCVKSKEPGLYEVGVKFVGILPPNFKEVVKKYFCADAAETA